MEGTSNATGVTPHGVRAGDPAALQGLVDRRGPAVVAFTTLVCGPPHAADAAAEAMARFRAAVRDSPDLAALDPEVLLRAATRHAAAAMARTPSGPPPHGRLRSRGTQTCEHVPVMLAARANGALGEADLERLARHLDRCERCAAMGEIFRRAELAYADPPNDTLGSETAALLIDALQSVSPEGPGYAPPPADPSELPTQITGALPTLPDLDDEIPLEPDHRFVNEHETPVAPPVARSAQPDGEPVPTWLEEESAADPRRRGRARSIVRFALPIVVVLGGGAAALVGSGALGGDSPAPPIRNAVATGIEPPVLTPLPVSVPAAKPKHDAAATKTPAEPADAPRSSPSAPSSSSPAPRSGRTDAGNGASGQTAAPQRTDQANTQQPASVTGGTGAPADAAAPGSADATGTTP